MIQPIDPEDIRKLIDAHGKRESITICMEEAAEYIHSAALPRCGNPLSGDKRKRAEGNGFY